MARSWAVNVDVVDGRGAHKLVCFPRAKAETGARELCERARR